MHTYTYIYIHTYACILLYIHGLYTHAYIVLYIYIQRGQISQKQDGCNTYAIMKTMCPPGYHHNGFVATLALGHM